MSRNELEDRFEKLVAEHGTNWKGIAEVLNRLGVQSPKGGLWNRENARAFYGRFTRKRETISQRSSSETTSEQLLQPLRDLPGWLNAEAWEDLHAMLVWWRERRSEPTQATRPVFRGKRRNTGVHINEDILTRAMAEAKKDKVRTGGSLSLLVELLLWQYIGSPDELLERPPADDQQTSKERP